MEADPVGEMTVVWVLALLLRLDPKAKVLKRELIAAIGLRRRRDVKAPSAGGFNGGEKEVELSNNNGIGSPA